MVGLIRASIDITARKVAEASLRESADSLREATRRLDAILNNTREAVFLMDEGYRCVYANAAAERLTGYRFEDLRGRPPLHDVVHHTRPDGRPYPMADCPIGCASLQGQQVSGEELFVAPDGSFYPVAYTASPVLDEEGRSVGTVLEARNIAEEKAAEAERRHTAQALAEAMADLEATFDAVPVAVWLARDPEARAIAGNRAARDLLRVTDEGANLSKSGPETGERLRHFRVLGPDGRKLAPHEMPVQRAARGEVVRDHEERIVFDDGAEVVMVGNAVPLFGPPAGRGAQWRPSWTSPTAGRPRESDERFRFALDTAGGIGTWDWDIAGDRVHASELFARMYGVKPERARSGLPVAECVAGIHPDDRAEVRRLIAEAVATGSDYRAEYRILTRDGGVRWVIARGRCLRDATGRPVRMPGVPFDITDRKAGEAALAESEQRFRNMADHAPVMMWVTDPEGACAYLNRGWYEFTGQTEAGALGLGWLEATHPDDKAEAERIFLEANARREPFRIEYRLRRANGTYRWAIDAAAPRFGAQGEFLGYIGSVIDIDEQREAEDRLRAPTNTVPAFVWFGDGDGVIR